MCHDDMISIRVLLPSYLRDQPLSSWNGIRASQRAALAAKVWCLLHVCMLCDVRLKSAGEHAAGAPSRKVARHSDTYSVVASPSLFLQGMSFAKPSDRPMPAYRESSVLNVCPCNV